MEQKLPGLSDCFQLQFLDHVSHVGHGTTVVEVLFLDEDDLLVQFVEVLDELSLTGRSVCNMPWGMKAERKRFVFYNEKDKTELSVESGQKGQLKIIIMG